MQKLNKIQLSNLVKTLQRKEHEVVLFDIVTTAITSKKVATDVIQNTPISLRTFGYGTEKDSFVASNFIFKINEGVNILYSDSNSIIALKFVYSNELELEIEIELKGGF